MSFTQPRFPFVLPLNRSLAAWAFSLASPPIRYSNLDGFRPSFAASRLLRLTSPPETSQISLISVVESSSRPSLPLKIKAFRPLEAISAAISGAILALATPSAVAIG